MKKLIISLLSIFLLLTFTGCSEKETSAVDDEVYIYTIEENKVTEQDWFIKLCKYYSECDYKYYSSIFFLNQYMDIILNKAYETTDEIKIKADEFLSDYRDSSNLSDDEIAKLLNLHGFSGNANETSATMMKSIKLYEEFYLENYDTYVKDFEVDELYFSGKDKKELITSDSRFIGQLNSKYENVPLDAINNKANEIGMFSYEDLISAIDSYVSLDKQDSINFDDALFTNGDYEFKVRDLYNILNTYADVIIDVILEDITNIVYKLVVCEDDSEIINQVNEAIEYYAEFNNSDVETVVSSMSLGFSTVTQYLNFSIYSTKLGQIAEFYINKNIISLIEETNPVKAKIMDVTDETKANKVIKRLQSGEDMSDLAIEYESSSYFGEEEIYFVGYSDMPECITQTLNNASLGLLESSVTDGGKYYIIEFTNVDPTTFEDELSGAWRLNGNMGMKALGSYAKEYDFKIYDEEIYDIIAQYYPELIN